MSPPHDWVVLIRRIASIVGIVLALVLPIVATGFQLFQLSMAMIYATSLIGLCLLTGFSGQISLGHGAFFGLGAYTTAILIQKAELNYVLALIGAAVLTFVIGGLFGLPALRLRGLYLALLSLGLATVLPAVLLRFDHLTGGSSGINIPSKVGRPPGWLPFDTDQFLYALALLVAVGGFTIARLILAGPLGRTMKGVRDNQLALSCLGVRTSFVKVGAFAVSSVYAGVAGGLYVLLIGYVSPRTFVVLLSITMLAALVVGGSTSLLGAAIGGVFLQYAPHYTSRINSDAPTVIYGVLLIVVMLVAPNGISGLLGRIARTMRNRRQRVESGDLAATRRLST